jgi:hypothetical protein
MLTNKQLGYIARLLDLTDKEMAESLGIKKVTFLSWMKRRAPRIQRNHVLILNLMCVRLVQQTLDDVLATYDLEGV